MMRLFILYLLIHSFTHSLVLAQNPATLESYVQLGLQSNLSLKQEQVELEKALLSIKLAKSNFSPKVLFNPTYSLAAGGRRLQFPVGDLLNPVYSTLNQLTKTNKFPQIENVNEQLAPNNFHETKISLQYPIYNSDIQYNYLIQKQLYSVQEAKKKVLENEIRYNIVGAYWQYLQTLEALKIFENTRNFLQDLVTLNQRLVANNVATKDVLYAAEYEVLKLDQQATNMNKNSEIAKAYFNFLLNRDLETSISVDTSAVDKLAHLPIGSLTDGENRQELNQIREGIKVAQLATKMQETNGKRPQIFVGGNTGFQGFGYQFSGQAFGIIQAGLIWELYHGGEKKIKIQQAKTQEQSLNLKLEETKRQIQLQIKQASEELNTAQKALRLAKAGTIKAQEYHKIVNSRYKNGQILLIEFLKSQNELLTAQLNESVAKFDILNKKAVLEKVLAVK